MKSLERTLRLAPLVLVGLVACGEKSTAPGTTEAVTTDIVNLALFIEDANRQQPTDPSTPLHENFGHNPILAPDQHHVTRGEFDAVRGSARAECVPEGTRIRLSLTGLIPNGVYTAWILTFE